MILPQGRGLKLGVGIVTYKRADLAAKVVQAVRRHTRHSFDLIIADDGSPESDVERISREAPVITGSNHGVCWNKNRALFYLHARCLCDVVILLEDDVRPFQTGWERDWIEAAERWGHVNFAGDWFRDAFVSGGGTAVDPFWSSAFSGQCTAFSREALTYVGYLDPRYRGFGGGHVEHTLRLARAGFGGRRAADQGMLYALLDSPLEVMEAQSARNEADVQRNVALFQTLQHDNIYRVAWTNDAEFASFRAEQTRIRGL
jgi:GT2 family glycosyltransferase